MNLASPPLGRSVIQRTLPGVSWLVIERVASLASALIVGIALTRYLGPADYGTLTFVLSFAAILLPISAAGLGELVTKELMDNTGRQGLVMGTVLAIRKGVGAAIVVLFGLFCIFGPFPDELTRIYAFTLVAMAIAGDASVFRNWFVANNELPRFARLNILRTLVFALTRLVMIVAGAGLEGFVIVAGVEMASSWCFAWVAFRLATAPRPNFQVDLGLVRVLLSKSWPLALSGIAAILNLKMDIVMLMWMTSPTETGLYGAAARLSEIWYIFPGLLMTALFPSLIEVRRADRASYRTLLQTTLDLLCAVAMVIAIATSLAAPMLVSLLYGPEFAPSASILAIHAWGGVFVFMRSVASKWIIAEELFFGSLVSHCAGAVANLVLNLMLIPRFGGEGAAMATVISYAISSYFAFALFARTRGIFSSMSAAFFWPLRIRQHINRLRAAR